ncbi:MAG: hypothetical protein IIB87_07650, partial [Chloroflexi bacterium]|nr:hypothetical protein [Chloroflexota bacterium]
MSPPADWKLGASAPVAVSGQPRTLPGRAWQRLKADLLLRFTLAFLIAGLIITFSVGLMLSRYLTAGMAADANRFATPGKFTVCHGNGCVIRSEVSLAGYHWGRVMGLFDEPAKSPARERKKISQAIAMIETIVGKKIGTHTDVGKNTYKYYDKGQMD